MTFEEFTPVFARLALALRATDADAVTAKTYFAVLKDLEVEFIVMAASRLAASAEWFPKTSEWRAMARQVERDRLNELRARLRQLPVPLCRECEDTGWRRDRADRVSPCDCRKLRRLEILGRRPMPALPDISEVPS